MYFYTSDLHLGHQRIIELCHRPFASVKEMNETMINNWNEVVGPDDVVYLLGDVALGKIADSLPLVGRLNGTIFLVPGNHDRIFSGEKQKMRDRFLPEYEKVFDRILSETVEMFIPEEDGGSVYPVVLSHFPYQGDSHDEDRYVDKRPVDNGYPLIHGHVHDTWRIKGNMFNVGVDVNGFRPVSETEIVKWLRTL